MYINIYILIIRKNAFKKTVNKKKDKFSSWMWTRFIGIRTMSLKLSLNFLFLKKINIISPQEMPYDAAVWGEDYILYWICD